MRLTLAGMSEDGRRLLLVDDAGADFELDVDHRLRAALRGETSRLGQLENQMDSVLRPRDIQARIRAGETPEAVAQAAQTSVERIMPFAGPVLAERQHVAERAQRSSVRRRPGSPADAAGAPRVLGDAVAAHLRSHQVDPTTVDWDAWRREDGRWTLTAEFTSIKRSGTARFGFDVPGNFVLAENDEARWLVGDHVEEVIPARDDLQDARARRLSVARPDEEAPLGEDALGLVQEADSHPLENLLDATPTPSAPEAPEAPETHAAPAAPVPPAASAPRAPRPRPETLDEPLDLEVGLPGVEPEQPAAAAEPAAEQEPEADPAPKRPAKNRRGRASVPSWDEIMFGGGKQE